VLAESYLLYMATKQEIKKKTGGPSKIWRGAWPTQAPP